MATRASELNVDLLIKMLGMTQSDNSNQALVAIRKANELVAKIDGGWDALLRGKVTVIADPFGSIDKPKASAWTPNAGRAAPRDYSYNPAGRPNPQPQPAPQPFFPEPIHTPEFDYSAARWDHRAGRWHSGFGPVLRQVAPTQTAHVTYAKRGAAWVLSSSERLDAWIAKHKVEVVRQDGGKSFERVGSFIETKHSRFIYNIHGKTNIGSASDLIF